MTISFSSWLKRAIWGTLGCLSYLMLEQAYAITGAGATFPFPLYAKWAEKFREISKGVELNYQSIGSGGGIKQIIAKTVDFGATDKPLHFEEKDGSKDSLKKHNLLQFPAIIGGVVIAYNLPGLNKPIKLSSSALAQIFLGQIKEWNDERIKKFNPELEFPKLPITVIHRSDGSGTTFLFTEYLGHISEEWRTKVGSDTAVSWPAGFGAKGNEGVTAMIASTPGALGYVEFSYAKPKKLATALLETEQGTFVEPSIDSFQAAALTANWEAEEGFYVSLTQPHGGKGWPITGASYILIHKVVDKNRAENVRQTLKFFDWAFTKEGSGIARELSYVPLPESLTAKIKASWSAIKTKDGQPLWPVTKK
ncbi:MAG TPA: phosphate ABC transporter substrate-binding protein PstS [Candidatus Nitrosotenuis sp.]|jgi:phosphate transport system substrate-binding protein|nr:phosphate ABC transporter substrate-binding protein PstS [Candidatus Nitrosotenuis sp.]